MSKRPTVMDTEMFKVALATPNKRFHDGHFYLTQRNTLYAYYPPLRVWIGRDGQCRTYELVKGKKSVQNRSGVNIRPASTKIPLGTTQEELMKIRASIMKEYGVWEPAEAAVGTKIQRQLARADFLNLMAKNAPEAPKSPREVIETIHNAAVRPTQAVEEAAEALAEAAEALDAAEAAQAAQEDAEASSWAAEADVVKDYENTLDYDVLQLLTGLWSRCGGSQEDLDWAREEFERIGLIPPPIQAQVTLTWSGKVSVGEMLAELASLGYQVEQP